MTPWFITVGSYHTLSNFGIFIKYNNSKCNKIEKKKQLSMPGDSSVDTPRNVMKHESDELADTQTKI
jgi:hypothetical protein